MNRTTIKTTVGTKKFRKINIVHRQEQSILCMFVFPNMMLFLVMTLAFCNKLEYFLTDFKNGEGSHFDCIFFIFGEPILSILFFI